MICAHRVRHRGRLRYEQIERKVREGGEEGEGEENRTGEREGERDGRSVVHQGVAPCSAESNKSSLSPPLRWVCKEWLSTNGMNLVRLGRMAARFTILADTGVCVGHTQPRCAVQRPIAF
jgi:hypothetical protein